MKDNGDLVQFLKQKDYRMVNNDLGSGSFGMTVLLQDPFIDELFVAKKYEPYNNEVKERFYKNFLDEIKIMYKLNHKNIVRIYDYYAYEDIYSGYILMEYIEGKDIGSFISAYFGPFEVVTIDNIFIQLIDGFQYLEEHGIIHRDIREGNILVDKTGTVKIIDFGIGKIFDKIVDSQDSLVTEINRDASDTLPQEYYDGVYTSKTDMFYLAELYSRLLRIAENIDDSSFSYQAIIDKMIQKRPENRYESFAEIKEAIDKHDFVNMEISQNDKAIYQSFANRIWESLTSYIEERKFNNDADVFIARLEKALHDNCFEDTIQSNADIISSVVVGEYKYSDRIVIQNSVVEEFLNWFKRSTKQSQQLILNNIISKIISIPVDFTDDDLPF